MKHASDVPAARILVIEDNGSDVFLLDRALKKQDLRFELVHLLNGGEALAFIRRQGAYADAADSRPDPDGLEPLQVHRRRHLARDPERQTPRRRSGVRVEFFPVPARQALLKDLGVSQFITKPAGLDQFMEIGKIIKDLLAAPRAG